MYNRDKWLRYEHFLMRYCTCTCNLLPEPTSPKHEYRRHLWCHPYMSSMTSSPWKKTFYGIIWDDLVTSDVKLKLCSIFFDIFKMAVILTSRQFILPYLILEVGYASKIYHFRHFGYLIDATAELLTKIWQFKLLVYFWELNQWYHEFKFPFYENDVTNMWYITCTTRHQQLYTCKLVLEQHQTFIVKSPGQTLWRTHTANRKQTKHRVKTLSPRYRGWSTE